MTYADKFRAVMTNDMLALLSQAHETGHLCVEKDPTYPDAAKHVSDGGHAIIRLVSDFGAFIDEYLAGGGIVTGTMRNFLEFVDKHVPQEPANDPMREILEMLQKMGFRPDQVQVIGFGGPEGVAADVIPSADAEVPEAPAGWRQV